MQTGTCAQGSDHSQKYFLTDIHHILTRSQTVPDLDEQERFKVADKVTFDRGIALG